MDLPETFTVQITQEDIRYGKRTECFACPLALAASRTLERPAWVTADRAGVELERARWAHNGFDFIRAFDDRESVSPRLVTFTTTA